MRLSENISVICRDETFTKYYIYLTKCSPGSSLIVPCTFFFVFYALVDLYLKYCYSGKVGSICKVTFL